MIITNATIYLAETYGVSEIAAGGGLVVNAGSTLALVNNSLQVSGLMYVSGSLVKYPSGTSLPLPPSPPTSPPTPMPTPSSPINGTGNWTWANSTYANIDNRSAIVVQYGGRLTIAASPGQSQWPSMDNITVLIGSQGKVFVKSTVRMSAGASFYVDDGGELQVSPAFAAGFWVGSNPNSSSLMPCIYLSGGTLTFEGGSYPYLTARLLALSTALSPSTIMFRNSRWVSISASTPKTISVGIDSANALMNVYNGTSMFASRGTWQLKGQLKIDESSSLNWSCQSSGCVDLFIAGSGSIDLRGSLSISGCVDLRVDSISLSHANAIFKSNNISLIYFGKIYMTEGIFQVGKSVSTNTTTTTTNSTRNTNNTTSSSSIITYTQIVANSVNVSRGELQLQPASILSGYQYETSYVAVDNRLEVFSTASAPAVLANYTIYITLSGSLKIASWAVLILRNCTFNLAKTGFGLFVVSNSSVVILESDTVLRLSLSTQFGWNSTIVGAVENYGIITGYLPTSKKYNQFLLNINGSFVQGSNGHLHLRVVGSGYQPRSSSIIHFNGPSVSLDGNIKFFPDEGWHDGDELTFAYLGPNTTLTISDTIGVSSNLQNEGPFAIKQVGRELRIVNNGASATADSSVPPRLLSSSNVFLLVVICLFFHSFLLQVL